MPQFVRALLIEPDEARRARLVATLAQATIEVACEDSLASALLRSDIDRFACIVSSDALAEGRGPQLVQHMRPLIPPVPLVLVGESDDESSELVTLRAGADEYVALGAVEGALARAVRRSLARDDADERRLQARHDARNAALGQVAAAIAHQVNNPIAFISSNNAVLRSYVEDLVDALGDLDQSGADAEWLAAWRGRYDLERSLTDAREICIDNAAGLKRVGALVNDLSSYSRPAQETRRYVDVNALVERAYWTVEPALRERARVDWQLSPVAQIVGEASHLEETFAHLLRNAMQALEPASSHDHRVTITTRMDQGEVIVEISDTGCGVAQSARGRIFEPFFSTRGPMGAGLGLAVCARVAARHGGRVEVESAAEGTRSQVRLPTVSGLSTQPTKSRSALDKGWAALVAKMRLGGADELRDPPPPNQVTRPKRRRSRA